MDRKVLTLSASGLTYRNTFVLYDKKTESLWYHLEGQDGLRCISGFYADRELKEFISAFIRWSSWLKENPGSKFLKAP
jgi:hypothetical protein